MPEVKNIVVTGANSGIGLALCQLLVTSTEHSCHVFLGSRSAEKGAAAMATIVAAFPAAASKIEVLVIDVSCGVSCAAAAAALKAKGVSLYALVNNAGVGLAHGDVGGCEAILNTNYRGPQRVTEALVGLVVGRVVNTSSGVASMFLREQDAAMQALYSSADTTQAELDASVAANVAAGNLGMGGGYGLSKAALTTLTMIQAKQHPHLTVVSLSPGFIDTAMTAGFGAKLTAEQGCLSSMVCLFGPVTTGCYYGSDGKRSPLTCTRDPGTPEYEGEPNPDPAKYNN